MRIRNSTVVQGSKVNKSFNRNNKKGPKKDWTSGLIIGVIASIIAALLWEYFELGNLFR